MKCSSCGAALKPGQTQCPYCGTSLVLGDTRNYDDFLRKLEMVDTYIKLKEYGTACKNGNELCDLWPEQYMAWAKKAEIYRKLPSPSIRERSTIEDCLTKCIILGAPEEVIVQLKQALSEVNDLIKKRVKEYESQEQLKRAEEEIERRRIQREVNERKIRFSIIMSLIAILLFITGSGKWYLIILWPIAGIAAFSAFFIICDIFGICV